MRVFQWLLSALIVVYLLAAPKWIRSGLNRDPGGDAFRAEEPNWYGVIELWHIASFKPGRGSITAYLEERATLYNKRHAGVHIAVKGLTEKQYRERIERGESPDAYSFACGLLYPEMLSSFSVELPPLIAPAVVGSMEGVTYAVPYLVSGYALAVNTQLLYKRGLDMPERVDEVALKALLGKEDTKPQFYAPEVFAAKMNLRGTLASREDFLSGGVLFGVVDLYTANLIRAGGRVQLMAEYLPVTDYTDLVQYLGPARKTDEVRRAILKDFAEFLLSDESQMLLTELDAMPVKAGLSAHYDDQLPDDFCLGIQSACAPDPFAYERHKQALTADALSALSGERNAQSAFNERLQVVLEGIS